MQCYRNGLVVIFFVAAATIAHANPSMLSQLSCQQASQDSIARQRWHRGGAPFGLAYERWTEQDFEALGARVQRCNPRDRGLRLYIEHLANSQKLSVGRLSAQESSDKTVAQNFERRIEAMPLEGASYGPLTDLCQEIRRSKLPSGEKFGAFGKCQNKLEAVKYAKQNEEEKQAASRGAVELERIKAKINSMPPTPETLNYLHSIVNSNKYRMPQLNFSQQNGLYAFVNSKIGDLQRQMADDHCRPVVEKIEIPAAIKDAVIDDGTGQFSLIRFLCGAILTTGRVSVRKAGSDDRYEIAINDATMGFELGRYLSGQRAFVGLKSPLKGGVPALRLIDARTPGGPIPVERYFITHLYAQFTPALSAYMNQIQNSATR